MGSFSAAQGGGGAGISLAATATFGLVVAARRTVTAGALTAAYLPSLFNVARREASVPPSSISLSIFDILSFPRQKRCSGTAAPQGLLDAKAVQATRRDRLHGYSFPRTIGHATLIKPRQFVQLGRRRAQPALPSLNTSRAVRMASSAAGPPA